MPRQSEEPAWWGLTWDLSWLTITTPWFAVRVVHPDGAVLFPTRERFTGIKIYYRRNHRRQEGDLLWLEEKELLAVHLPLERRLQRST